MAFAVVANGAVCLGAGEVLRRIRSPESSVNLLLFLLFRILIISAVVILAGISGSLSPFFLGLAGVLAAGVLIATGSWRRVPRWSFPDADRWLTWFAVLILLRLLLQVWFFAPHVGDALSYHLPKVAQWIRSGGFSREMGLHPHVTFPAGFELIEAWWVVFLHHDVLIEMAGVEFLFLAAVSTYCLGRRLGLAPRWCLFSGIAYSLTPGLHLSATSCLNDVPVAALTLATFALVAWRSPWWAITIPLGLGAGVKATYLFALPGPALYAFLVRKEGRLVLGMVQLGAIAAVLSIGVGGFWFARNLSWYGNPIYPVGTPGYASEAVAVQGGPRLYSLVSSACDLADTRIFDNRAPYGPHVDNISGWGAVVFACGLPMVTFVAAIHPGLLALLVAFVVSLGSTFLMAVHDPYNLKYVFFAPAVFVLSIPIAVQAVPNAARVATAAMVYSFLSTFFSFDMPLRDAAVLARQPWTERSALPLFCDDPMPTWEHIACFGGFEANAYLLYGPDFSRGVEFLRPDTAEALTEDMVNCRANLLYAAPHGERQAAILEECVKSGSLRPLGGKFYSLVRESGQTNDRQKR